MKSILYITIIFSIFFFIEKSLSATSNKILVKVGNKIITNYELKNKILTTLVLSKQNINQTNINKIKKQSIDSLIQKKIKQIELDKYKYEVNQSRVDNYLKSISSNNILEFKNNFQNNNISFDLFLEEIQIQFKWQQLILNIYSPKIEINQANIDKEINLILEKQKRFLQYRLSEIEIPINNDESDKTKLSDIMNLINENGFEDTALKFSSSSTAERKGDLGWINSKSISKNILKIIKNLEKGEISQPIIRQGSATILKLIDIKKSDINDLDLKKLRIDLINNKKDELFNLYSQSLLSKLKNTTLIEYLDG